MTRSGGGHRILKDAAHRRALQRLEELLDLEHMDACERVQAQMWSPEPPEQLPVYISFPPPPDWPTYPFTQTWDDVERKFMTAMATACCGVLLRDDRLCTLDCEYGVVNIPELFGVPSVITDTGWSMSEGLGSADAIRALIDRGVPDVGSGHGAKMLGFFDFAREVVAEYPTLEQALHYVVPDNQGPFDLAHLVWGSGVFYALHDEAELVHALLDLMTETYIQFTLHFKRQLGEPIDSGYHICGVRLLDGGVRICDDTPVMCSADVYSEFVRPYNERVYAPFGGGWLHFCGDGRHLLDQMLVTEGVNIVHMGNPDNWELPEVYEQMQAAGVRLIWSGSLDRLGELRERCGGAPPPGLMILAENRYAATDLDSARETLRRVRAYEPIERSAW